MHDILEGALQYEAKLLQFLLKQFVNCDHYFTLIQLNQQFQALELGISEVKSRPSPISSATLLDGDGHLKQSGKWFWKCLVCTHITTTSVGPVDYSFHSNNIVAISFRCCSSHSHTYPYPYTKLQPALVIRPATYWPSFQSHTF